MVHAGDSYIQYPVKDLYDKDIMKMSIAVAKDMYEKGLELIKDFYKEYGDFMSPFSKDMDRYNEIVGGVRNAIQTAYDNGIDPLRSAEGRAFVLRAIASVNPAELSAMRANAKTGYAYLDAMQKLRSQGKFSKDQEDFDIALNKGTAFNDFATTNGAGGFNSWDRTSPIEATTLRDLTYDSYKGRSARVLTKEDFDKDPRLKNYAWDPRYEWTGYLDSDLLKNAPGASLSLKGDPRAAFFRDQAMKKVIARGEEPTEAAVEQQFLRDIADANSWALIDPERKANEFAKMDYEDRLQRNRDYLNHKYRMAEKEDPEDNQSPGYDFYFEMLDKGFNNVVGMPGGSMYELGPGGKYVSAQEYFHGSGKLIAAQKEFGETVAKNGQNKYRAFRNKYVHTDGLSGEVFAEFMKRPLVTGSSKNKFDWSGRGLVRLDPTDIKRITSIDEMITNTAGYTGQYKDDGKVGVRTSGMSRKEIRYKDLIEDMKTNPEKYLIGGNNISVYGAYRKPGSFRNDFIVDVWDTETGKKVGQVALDSYIGTEKVRGGFYQKRLLNNNEDVKENTNADLIFKLATEEGSTAVNKLLGLSRKQNMPEIFPYTSVSYK